MSNDLLKQLEAKINEAIETIEFSRMEITDLKEKNDELENRYEDWEQRLSSLIEKFEQLEDVEAVEVEAEVDTSIQKDEEAEEVVAEETEAEEVVAEETEEEEVRRIRKNLKEMKLKGPLLVPVQIHTLKPRDPHNTTHDSNEVFQIYHNFLHYSFAFIFNCEGNKKSVSSQTSPLAVYKPALCKPGVSSVSPGTSISWVTFS